MQIANGLTAYRRVLLWACVVCIVVSAGCRRRIKTETTVGMDSPERTWIRVLLFGNLRRCTVASENGFLVEDARNGITAEFGTDKPLPVLLLKERILIGEHVFGREVLIKPKDPYVFYIDDDKKYLSGDYKTPSGKIEIYSETLAENGYDPLPEFVEPSQSPVSNPEMAKKYPLILTTGARIEQYTHSQLRNVPSLRAEAPEPIAELSPETAAEYGIADGDMMVVETPKDHVTLKAHTIEELAAGIVSIPHGWSEANANYLTSLDVRDPITGYTEMKALLCTIRKG